MPTLAELQKAFGDAVLTGDQARVADLFVDGPVPARERLQIHRNTTIITLTESLTAVYPVLQRLVGEEFFAALCREFILAQPPREPSLIYYGGELADFLEGFAPVDGLPYVPDVARLEWAWHGAYHAADTPPLTAARLAALDPAELPAIGLELHPTRRFIASLFPILRIWQANQPAGDAKKTIDLTAGGDGLLVIRPRMDVEIRRLDPAQMTFLMQLDGGAPLGRAAAAALKVDPAFDIRETLHDLITSQTFANIVFPEKEPSS